MSNLVKVENANKYQLALTSVRFTELPKNEAVKILTDIVSRTLFEAGQSMDERTMLANMMALYEEIKSGFQFIRTEEIRLAFSNGVRGEYGEFYGMNIKTWYSWLKSYQTSEKRRLELAKSKFQLEDNPFDKAEARKLYWEKIAKDIQKFKETGYFQPYMPLKMFRTFWNQGIIRISKDEAAAYKVKAMEQIRQDREMVSKPVNKKEHQVKLKLNTLISAFESNQLSTEQDMIIKEMAAELCLRDYFKNCDLQEFINQTK